MAVLVTAVGLVVLPLARLVQVVRSEGGVGSSLASPMFATALRNTVLLALAVTAAAVPIGVALALALRRPDVPGRAVWRVAVLLPVLVPDFVLGYSWTQAYGPAGFIDTLLGWGWAGLSGPVGVWVVLVVNATPIAYLVNAAGLGARGEAALERAARASGAGPVTTLRTITLRLLAPAIAAAAVLVFALTLGAFAIPQVLGAPAGFRTVATQIYADLSLGGDPSSFAQAVTLALVLVLVGAVCVAPADAVLGPRLRAVRTGVAHGAAAGPVRPAAGRGIAVAFGGWLVLTVGLPLLALVLASVTRAVGLPPTPAHWSLVHFRQVLTPRTFEALGRSAVLALLAATVLLVLGAGVASIERRRAGRATATLLTLTFVLPGSTLAVALFLAYGRWLSGTAALILLAYLAKFFALAHRPISGALDRLSSDEWRAARASGASWLPAARTVALPPLAPALLAAWLVCFLTGLHEVTMSSLLYGPGSETLAVVVLNTEELGQIGSTAALSVVLTVLVAVPALLLWPAVRGVRAWRAVPPPLGVPAPASLPAPASEIAHVG
ncbi:MAG: transrane component of transporter [Frankiales bacterium]|nr:transrane component of transporter [Frankiales bacterium]